MAGTGVGTVAGCYVTEGKIIRNTGQTFGIGQSCDVQVVSTDIPRGEVTLRLITEPAPPE